MTDTLRKVRVAKLGIAKVGNTRLGLIPALRDRDTRVAGDGGPLLYYAQSTITLNETGLGHTEVDQ